MFAAVKFFKLGPRTVDGQRNRVQPNHSNLRLAPWLLALFLTVLGAKLWVIRVYGSAVPFWDQWDEARLFIKPWLEGRLPWGAWFAAHNEHRIFFTRLLDMLVLWLNQQWDPILQMIVNAVLHAGYACGLAYALWRFTGRKSGGLICFLLMPFFALPFAAENTLHGFQSQMYFLNIFAVITIVGLGFGAPGSGWWWFGLAAAFLSIFTMASGFLAAVAVIGLTGLRMLRARGTNRRHWITFTGCLAVVVAGLVLNVSVPGHKPYQANSPIMFWEVLVDFLAWPFGDHSVMAWFVCLPLLITCVVYFQAAGKSPQAAELVLSLALWSFLQMAALAYGRAHGISNRYLDITCTLALASLASLFVLAENLEYRRLSRPFLAIVAVLWVGVLFAGLWQTARGLMGTGADRTRGHYMELTRQWTLKEEDNLRAFLATDNLRYLTNQPGLAIPYPDGIGLANMLRDPSLQRILPPECRPPLKLEKDEKTDGTFEADGYPPDVPAQPFTRAWGNYRPNGTNATGSFVSQPLCPALPKLIVPLGWGSSLEGIEIQLVEEHTGRVIDLRPETTDRWQTLVVTAPRKPFRLKITVANPRSWVAVGDLQETGCLSYYGGLLLKQAVTVLLAGLGVYLLLAGAAVVRGGIGPGSGAVADLLIGLTGLVIMTQVWSTRNFDVGQLKIRLQKRWAQNFTSTGNPPEVEMHLRDVLWLQPHDPETLVALANALIADPSLDKARAREQAVGYYEAALKLKPDYPQARQQLDQMLTEMGHPDTATP